MIDFSPCFIRFPCSIEVSTVTIGSGGKLPNRRAICWYTPLRWNWIVVFERLVFTRIDFNELRARLRLLQSEIEPQTIHVNPFSLTLFCILHSFGIQIVLLLVTRKKTSEIFCVSQQLKMRGISCFYWYINTYNFHGTGNNNNLRIYYSLVRWYRLIFINKYNSKHLWRN